MAEKNDPFGGQSPILNDPYDRATAVDISTVDFVPGQVTRAIYVGGGGDLKVDLGNGQGVISAGITFKAVPAGTTLRLRILKVYKTGTTATNMMVTA